MKMTNNLDYPGIITRLPQIDISIAGVNGWLSQGADHQIVFFEIEPVGKIPEHKHGAQWGVVISGEMELTINGIRHTYCKGDSYFIPKNALHSAVFNKKTIVMDFFEDVDRYKTKMDY